jgi:UDP-N-acetylmuramoyl-tripeptide--D-alanyl-D-alanine ligase
MTISASLQHAPPILLSEIIEATAPEIIGDLSAITKFRWIERNSREIKRGDLFIAVCGERFDGHDFVGDAASRGAAAALVSKEWAAAEAADSEIPLIAVDEPVMALQRIAAARRARMALQVVGVTGSIGKSSTKEVIASVLRTRFPTYHSPGNMNSEIGLPLSLLEIAPETECAVLEMGGAYAFGELALLANIAKPVVGVVTNVHPVHLERMGTIEAIAKTKAELVEALPASGVAVLNGDDVRVRAMAAQTQARVVTYGRGSENVVRASDIQTRGLDGITFALHLDGTQTTLTLPMVGSHAVDLALAAVSVGWAMGLRLDEMVGGLADRASQIRLLTKIGPRGARLIDDTYNASAPSVLSALGLLQEIECERRIAVLGEMRELGAESASQHQQVGQRAGEVVDLLATFGPMGQLIADAARESARIDGRDIEIMSFDLQERDLLVRELEQSLQAGDTVLLKGSRGLMMETIVDSLESSNPSDHQS